jgi:hypothetical protein
LTTGLTIRRSTPEDLPAVLGLLRACLGWGDDARYDELFRWKHLESPFGESPAWVALDGETIVGLRILMRWEFEIDGRVQRAVRAVDTATHREYRGRRVFTELTLRAVEELGAEPVDFIFNTPNQQSLPGYLKMGWRVVGRLPVVVRPRSARALGRMMRARAPAERWSASSTAGSPAEAFLSERDRIAKLLASRPSPPRMRTRVTPEYLRWRYASPVLPYRAVAHPDGLDAGLAIFRVRQRGGAREAALCEVLLAEHDRRNHGDLVRRLVRAVDADYVIGIDARPLSPGGLVRLPRQGPVLTWRGLKNTIRPARDSWGVGLGDVELF